MLDFCYHIKSFGEIIVKITRREHVFDGDLEQYIKDPVLRQLMARRGVLNKVDFDCELKDLLHYKDLKNIEIAQKLIADAICNQEHILIAGDYDVDGLTGTALGKRALALLGAKFISVYVPSRYEGGYGLNIEAIKKYVENKQVSFIITVDNGVSCNEAVEYAEQQGIKVVITDHHETQEVLPKASCIVDPKQPGDKFASKNLCGAGVLFYVLCAVKNELLERGFYKDKEFVPNLSVFLDLVALGTIGDVVPLDSNNRRLVKAGFRRFHKGACAVGIKVLSEIARLDLKTLNAVNISFDICPRLNAAGRIRLDDNPAADLLLTDDVEKARELALRLDMCNRRRGDYERVALKEAREDAKAQIGCSAITLYRPSWLPGIAGLLAGRIKDSCNVPCFVFSGDDEIISGSARSVPGFAVAQILQKVDVSNPGLLLRYGGHAMAAGASIKRENLDRFRAVFNKQAKECTGGPQELEMVTDGTLPTNYLSLDFARDLERAGPWGNGFPEPTFDGEYIIEKAVLVAGRHLRLLLQSCDDGAFMWAIKMRANAQEKALAQGMKVQVVYALGVNRYFGSERLEVRVEAICLV